MAAVNTKSNSITDWDASPKVRTPMLTDGGTLREKVATLEIAAADDDTSTYRFVRVHSSWRISEITLFNDAITSGAVFDLGLYRTAEDGGAVVDANAYADNISLTSGSLTGVQLLFEAGSAKGVEDIEEAIYKDAGLTEDPNVWYDIVLTGDTVGSGAGTVSLRVRYVANGA